MKKMSKGILMTALICGAVYLGGSPVYANELQEFALDEYVVTAARTETKLVDTPANISVVDAQTIEERHYQDVSEVLKDVPGANVVDNGNGGNERAIILNGDDRVLIMVDGRRVNLNVGTSTGNAGFDMNMLPDVNLIERIEVLKGAGGALYGSDAVGGVVNIITKKAVKDFGKVSVAYGSMGAKDYSAIYSFKEGKTGVNVAASKYEQDYYKYRDAKTDTTKRWPGDTSYENNKLSLQIEQKLSDSTNLTVGYDINEMNGGSNGFITSSMSYFFNIDKKNENVYAKYDWNINGTDNGYLQIYHNDYEYNAIADWSTSAYKEDSYGFDLQQAITTSNSNKLVIGASFRDADIESNGDSVYSENINNKAIFVNNTWEFSPTWTLNAGIRYDDHNYGGNETTMSAGLNKKINDDSHLYMNWGQVFRAPTSDDLFYTMPGYYPDNVKEGYGGSYGNPNLKAETGDTWTIGYSTRLNNKTNLSANYFESDLNDAINWDTVLNQGQTDWVCNNVDKQKKRGLELSVNHSLNKNVSFEASYTYLKVENQYMGQGDYIRDTNYIPNMYRLGAKYHDGKWDVNAWLRYGSGADTSLINNDYVDEKYLTLDMAITYKATEDLNFYAKGYNLFNEAYAEFAGVTNGSYDRPAQSRRFIVGAEYKF